MTETTKIPEPWKSQWIAALRSGKYDQGQFSLRSRNDEFCCLGVLCDLVVPDQWSQMDGRYSFSIDGTEDILPNRVIDRLDIRDNSPTIACKDLSSEDRDWFGVSDDPGHDIRLFELNDDYNLSFSQIADLIERYM